MAEGLRSHCGGILGLYGLLVEHREAIEYELLAAGKNVDDLSTRALSWRDLYVLIRRWQKLPGNAVAAAVHGYEVPTFDNQIIAIVAEQLAVANWQRKGGKGAKPKPLERWWKKKKTQQFGKDPIPASKFSDWWESKKRR